MRLTGIEIRTTSDHVRLIGRVVREATHKVVPWAINEAEFKESSANGIEAEVYFEFPMRYESFISQTADAFAIALMLPSMATGEPLEIDLPVSETLLFNLAGIQDVFHSWHPQFERVPIHATSRIEPSQPKPHRAASFFSGGVDSFFTLLKRLDHDPLPAPLTHLIFMHGVEQKLEHGDGVDLSQRRAEKIAALTGIECIVGTTNLRTVFPLHWERYYVGTVLSATSVALAGGFGYVCIPSSFTHLHQDFPTPHGTTPLIDERYSTELIRVVHDGAEATRAEKTASIAEWNKSLVLQNLRVCMDNAGGDFNCGKCYKCVRTAVALKAIGLWEESLVFPDKSTSHWEKVVSDDHLVFTEENLALARERGIDFELIQLLERVVRKLNRYDALAIFAKNSPLERLLPIFRKLRELLGSGPRTH